VREAEKRRQELSSGNEMKQQLNQIKNVQAGPADKLANALKKADFQKARQELDKLQQQLAGDKLSEPEKQALAKQIEQMQQSLEKMTEAHKKAVDELREKVDSERKSGNVAEANKLQQQLDKLAQQKPQVDKLEKMAQQLKQASKSMREGDAKQAAAALDKLSNEMAGMQKDMQELATLETALDELADCKNAMACQECDGEGCAACEGNRPSSRWSRSKNAKGQGIGAGEREESKTRTNFFDSQVKQNVGKGASVVTGLADGPNRKGQVQEAIRGDYSDAEQQATEALSDQRLPHDYREHAKAYFDTFREGQR
jgi:DNA repair exonuclease SbcCD ATPase subunit